MAAVGITAQQIVQVADLHLVFSKFKYNNSGDTVAIPTGATAAAVLYGSGEGTAPSTSVAAGQNADTVTLTGGQTGVTAWLVSRHSGNPAALGGGSVSS